MTTHFTTTARCVAAVALLSLLAFGATPLRAGVITNEQCLPPVDPGDAYLGTYFQWSAPGVVLSNVMLSGFGWCTMAPTPGNTVSLSTTAIVQGDLYLGGAFQGRVVSDAQVPEMITATLVSGSFNAEITQLDFSINSPWGTIMVRESPILASAGETTITDLGGGGGGRDPFEQAEQAHDPSLVAAAGGSEQAREGYREFVAAPPLAL